MQKPTVESLRTEHGVQEFMCEVIVELCDESYPPKYGNDRLKGMVYAAKTLADMIASSKISKMTDEEIIALFRTRFAHQIKRRDGEPAAAGSH